jgi:hypothetical protein
MLPALEWITITASEKPIRRTTSQLAEKGLNPKQTLD